MTPETRKAFRKSSAIRDKARRKLRIDKSLTNEDFSHFYSAKPSKVDNHAYLETLDFCDFLHSGDFSEDWCFCKYCSCLMFM